jgi:hypothetical protein
MYGQNTPAKFTTDHGSTYTVVAGGVTRMKSGDPNPHGGVGKNIFYCTYHDSEIILKPGTKNFRVANLVLTFEDEDDKTINVAIVAAPKVGLCPVDLFLNANGTATDDDHLHVGHTIDKIL